MGQCQLVYRLKEPAAALLEQIRDLAREYQGEVQGNEHSGKLSLPLLIGTIDGEYTITGDQLELIITKKPFLLGCQTIDAVIRQYLTTLEST